MMSTTMDTAAKLSCLQALKPPTEDDTEVWVKKRHSLQQRKDAFVMVTAVNNLAKFVSFAAPAVESVERSHATSARSLTSTMDACESIQSQIESQSEKLVEGLKQMTETQAFVDEGRKRLHELPVTVRLSQKDLQTEEASLSRRLEELESQAEALERLVDKSGQELDSVKSDLSTLMAEEKRHRDERSQMKETEGPQRERLGLMTSFVMVKKGIHEKLSGYEIVSISGDGKQARVGLKEDLDTFVELEFNDEHALVGATSQSIFNGTKIELALRDLAISENRPATFIRGIKMLVHNADSLDKELEDLRQQAKSTKKPFGVEYNPAKRILTAVFNRGSVYAKLRIPLDYTVSTVDLIHLERPESSKSLRPVAQQVQDKLMSTGRGRNVTDWVMELCELL